MTTKTYGRCDQCEAAMINGLYCHETGCPNARPLRRRYVECRECGREFDLTNEDDAAELAYGHDCEVEA